MDYPKFIGLGNSEKKEKLEETTGPLFKCRNSDGYCQLTVKEFDGILQTLGEHAGRCAISGYAEMTVRKHRPRRPSRSNLVAKIVEWGLANPPSEEQASRRYKDMRPSSPTFGKMVERHD